MAKKADLPRKTKIGGQDHLLAYITPQEARMLRKQGNGVTPTGGQYGFRGVPAFRAPGNPGVAGGGTGAPGSSSGGGGGGHGGPAAGPGSEAGSTAPGGVADPEGPSPGRSGLGRQGFANPENAVALHAEDVLNAESLAKAKQDPIAYFNAKNIFGLTTADDVDAARAQMPNSVSPGTVAIMGNLDGSFRGVTGENPVSGDRVGIATVPAIQALISALAPTVFTMFSPGTSSGTSPGTSPGTSSGTSSGRSPGDSSSTPRGPNIYVPSPEVITREDSAAKRGGKVKRKKNNSKNYAKGGGVRAAKY